MRLEDGVLVLEKKDCTACKYSDHPGRVAKQKWKKCEKCKGSGRRGNGRCRNCTPSYANPDHIRGHVIWYDHDDLEPCRSCGGNYHNFKDETYTDNVPPQLFADLPITVVGDGTRPMTTAEGMFGVGIYTVIDYGRHKAESDEDLTYRMYREFTTGKTTVQACKVVKSKDDLTFCTGLAIMRANHGFSVVPTWD